MEKTPYLKEQETVMQHDNSPSGSFEKEYSDLVDLAVHDLDAPLRKLTLLVGMLTSKLLADKDLQSYGERIVGCIEDMRSLIDDLSVLAKINETEPIVSSCNLDLVVQQAINELPKTIKDKQAVITSLSLPVIDGDNQLFTRLFRNLLENAIKFNKKNLHREIHITSSILSSEEKTHLELNNEKHFYRIEISDNGIGFKNENAARIFQPFVRLHGKSQFPGNGIGLAICKKITDIHHGIIYAEGRENEGARFILILPERH
ncbi:MAG: ATP-binding protein [Chitinophagales bacterium]